MKNSSNGILYGIDSRDGGEINILEIERQAAALRAQAIAESYAAMRRYVAGLFGKREATADTTA